MNLPSSSLFSQPSLAPFLAMHSSHTRVNKPTERSSRRRQQTATTNILGRSNQNKNQTKNETMWVLFPYSTQILFPFVLNVCCTISVGIAVFHCNYMEVTNGWQNILGVSIGFWQTSDEINGRNGNNNHDGDTTTGTTTTNGLHCVPWTKQQINAFDIVWNYGRYSGILTFIWSLVSVMMMALMIHFKLSPGGEIFLVALQFSLALFSGLLMVVVHSRLCDEFDCWPDIGGVLSIIAASLYLVSDLVTLSIIGFATKERKRRQLANSNSNKTPRGSARRFDLSDEMDIP